MNNEMKVFQNKEDVLPIIDKMLEKRDVLVRKAEKNTTNPLIEINFDNGRPTVSGRELHEFLEINTPYHKWFPRMCEYGFVEDIDFNSDKFVRVQKEGNREVSREITDHQITIPMAKELCMLQRNEKGKQARLYFISVEEEWNTPEAVMARALQIANNKLLVLTQNNKMLEEKVAEMQPKVSYCDYVLQCEGLIPISVIAKDYGKSAKWMNNYLAKKGVQYKQGKIWLLYQKYAEKGYTNTKTVKSSKDEMPLVTVHTYWTQQGRLFIYNLLKNDGLLPLMECNNEKIS